ncbi:hypothetical protein Y88_1309 [Novosphingobium nitrogenifigens DSM 19370]|uniref:Uncharacterized protein n=1 Tax=Novosphingobium nitrogenifigens DSM 19370 TaxID=983920 RepID=F1Z7X8_9SPHN|nr:hypothetical protein Y88_1309 [Novosphingobium nitrogenifigens DSM 19370]
MREEKKDARAIALALPAADEVRPAVTPTDRVWDEAAIRKPRSKVRLSVQHRTF